MHRFTPLRTAAVGLIAVALLLTACSPGTDPEPAAEGDRAESLRLGSVTPLASFAPWEASWANQSLFLQPVYDTLLRTEPDGTVVAGLATQWEWNDDRTVLTLTLRDGVEFTDGEALTAEVAAEYLMKFRDGTSENSAFLAGMTSAEATDATTLVITLDAPDPSLPVYLSQNAGLVGSPAMLDAADAQTTPVGSGPYVLDTDATVIGSTYVYEANDDYWAPEEVAYDKISVTLYGDPTALMNAIKGGQVDAVNLHTPTQIPEAEAAGFTVERSEQNWVGTVIADRDGSVNPAFADVRVRQAYNHALDREGLLQALGGGYGTPTTQVFARNSVAYDAALDDRYPHDPDRAKELLAEAGYPDGVTIVMPSSDFNPESTYALQADSLAKSGFTVEWEQAGDDLFGRMLGGSWASFGMLLQSDPTPWQTVQFSMLPTSTWNPFHTEDAEVTALAERIRMGGDDGDAAAAELNAYIVEQAWFAPLYRPESGFAASKDVTVTLQSDNAVPYLWNIRPAR